MKKIFWIAAAVAGLFAAASCQKESANAGDAVVTLSVEVPASLETKAIAKAENADIVYYEVWDANWSKQLFPVDNAALASEKVENKKATVELTLVADQTYNFIFWAQNEACGAYDVNELKKVKVNYDVISADGNNDVYDAYYAVKALTVTGPINETITLYRPFAQLNFGASKMESDLGAIKIGTTAVTVDGLATVFNTIAGVGETPATAPVTFAAEGLASTAEKLVTNNSEYTWVTMDYMLMMDEKTTVDITADFEVEGIGTVHHEVNAVPLERNYRTNIVGDLFTTDAKLQIVIDPAFKEPDYVVEIGKPVEVELDPATNVYKVSNAGHILWLAQQPANFAAGKTIEFTADIDMMNQGITPINPSGSKTEGTVVIGNGYTVSNFSVLSDDSAAGLFGTMKGSIDNLNVKNVTVEGHHYVGALVGYIYGSVTNCEAENVTVTSVPQIYNSVYDNGDKAGALIGYFGENTGPISGNTVDGAVVTAYRDLGGLVGCVSSGVKVDNNKVSNVSLIVDQTPAPYNGGAKDANAAAVVGRPLTTDDLSDNPVSNVTITYVDAVDTIEELRAAVAKEGSRYIRIAADLEGDVTIVQKPNTVITLVGQNHKYSGVITVDGKSGTYTTAGLVIKDLTFEAASISKDACIRLGAGTNDSRYTCNVTVDNCTFDVPGAVGIKSYTGGDKNLTVTGCKATANTHSLVQAKGIDGILVENCDVYSKNGLNFNNSDNVEVVGCEVEVRGYAVRFGESSGGAGAAETYSIKNCTLKTDNSEGDPTIVLRGTADNATLTIENTTIEGATRIGNTASGATVIIDGQIYL